jgi:hypothetical protein
MDSDEEYVRSRWEKAYEPIAQRGLIGIDIWVEGSIIFRFHGDNRPAAWQAAADFTHECEEQIRQVEREIWLLDNKIKTFTPAIDRAMEGSALFAAELVREQYAWYRILAARQAALAELQRGWKQAEVGHG